LQAASYAAYAVVYASGGYGAVIERESFETEFSWQLKILKELSCLEIELDNDWVAKQTQNAEVLVFCTGALSPAELRQYKVYECG
jgi:hypothetical protein